MKQLCGLAVLIFVCLSVTACQKEGQGNRITQAGDGARQEAQLPEAAGDPEQQDSQEDAARKDGSTAWGDGNAGREDDEDGGQEEAFGKKPEVKVLENLSMESALLSDTFCKAGDVNCRFSFYVVPEDGLDIHQSERLGISFSIQRGGAERSFGYGDLMTAEGTTEYELPMILYTYEEEGKESQEELSLKINFAAENSQGLWLQVKGSQIAEGDYYREAQISPEVPELFSRYLCRAELCVYPTEMLSLLRNTIYAAHGRKFQSEAYRQYFEEKPWYRGIVDADHFSEAVLSDIEKENIRMIQELEGRDEESRKRDEAWKPENLEAAPYLSFLNINKETGLSADISRARDEGLYWSAPGQILLPVTLTQDQWEIVSQNGSTEVCTNELTGEGQILERLENGNYILYEKGAVPDPLLYPDSVGIRYNFETRLYELWMSSDDTIMKPVYEGEIRILKGAVFGTNVSLAEASKGQQAILPEPPSGNAGMTGDNREIIYGNSLRCNNRGYLTAIYYLGD